MQRALGVEEPPIPFISSKTPTPSPSPVKHISSTAQKKDTTQSKDLHPSSSQQSKPLESDKQPGQDSSSTAKETSTPHPQQKTTQQQKVKDAISPAKSEPPTQTELSKEQPGIFGFRSGGARSRSPSPQPSVSAVSGKVLGFGSSLFSSASNLISAVQDESSAMQPTSRKSSSVSQSSDKSTPPASRKGSEASKDFPKLSTPPKQEQQKNQPTKATADQTKEKPTSSQSPKASPKLLPKACPICKVGLKREPPNYNTCTECKTTVCIQCGFNPMPHQPEVRKTEKLHLVSVNQHFIKMFSRLIMETNCTNIVLFMLCHTNYS